jgi:hypothetical protein
MATGLELEQNISFKIVTGDGKEWNPDKIQQGGASLNPNTSGYDKPNVQGSEVRRNSGSSPSIDLLFQMPAENTAPFLESSKNPETWKVTHPLYGSFDCMPVSIDVNTGAVDGHIWTIKVWQTIGTKFPVQSIDVKTDVALKSSATLDIALTSVTELTPSDVDKLEVFILDLEVVYNAVMNSEIKALIDDALDLLLNGADSVTDVMKAIEAIILIPRDLNLQIKDKVLILEAQYLQATNIVCDTINMCQFFESTAAQNNCALSQVIVNPNTTTEEIGISTDNTLIESSDLLEPDYRLRKDILDIALRTEQLYNASISAVDERANLGILDENGYQYIPREDIYANTDITVSASVSGLNDVAFDAKTETIHITESETTTEWLAWKLYGKASDENIQLIIDANDLFGKDTLENSWRNLVIQRNKSIIYYS